MQGFDRSSWIITAYMLTYTSEYLSSQLLPAYRADHDARVSHYLGEVRRYLRREATHFDLSNSFCGDFLLLEGMFKL